MMEIKNKYKKNRQLRVKQVIRRLISGKIIKKYRMLNRARLAIRCRNLNGRPTDDTLKYTRKGRSDQLAREETNRISSFYERDDNSRLCPGKKDTITRKKIKKQKRLLSESIKTLHMKFCFERPEVKVSYPAFCKLRPFWVVNPKMSDVNTCLCKRHSNIQMMADKLHREGVISSSNVSEQCVHLTCNIDNKNCMYGTCDTCKVKRLPAMDPDKNNKEVTYFQWVTKEKKCVQGEEGKQHVKVTVKETRNSTLADLHDKLETELKPRFTTHIFNISHQYKTLRSLRENLQDDEVIVHIDFSEYYTCKYGEGIQSVHFGGSHQQACYIQVYTTRRVK